MFYPVKFIISVNLEVIEAFEAFWSFWTFWWCFSGLVTRESWKTTPPCSRPRLLACYRAASRLQLSVTCQPSEPVLPCRQVQIKLMLVWSLDHIISQLSSLAPSRACLVTQDRHYLLLSIFILWPIPEAERLCLYDYFTTIDCDYNPFLLSKIHDTRLFRYRLTHISVIFMYIMMFRPK